MIDESAFKQSLSGLLAEAFGVSDSEHGIFLDTGQSGLLGAVAGLDAASASAAITPNGESIAAHCGHVLYILHLFNTYEQGKAVRPDWESSWQTHNVDEAGWTALQADLRHEYEAVTAHLQARWEWPPMALGAWLMLTPHVAYHVGVIHKQLALLSK